MKKIATVFQVVQSVILVLVNLVVVGLFGTALLFLAVMGGGSSQNLLARALFPIIILVAVSTVIFRGSKYFYKKEKYLLSFVPFLATIVAVALWFSVTNFLSNTEKLKNLPKHEDVHVVSEVILEH